VERVLGIGGVFLRGRDPVALRAWYAEQLGVPVEDWGGFPFRAEQDDVTVWSVFPADSDYWDQAKDAMINFRVRDLEAMLAQLRAGGAPVDEKRHEDENGSFGWTTDPEGNRIELWQPRQSSIE
jgi:predicted enzyme related to lactoylglutathione lyase